jgi:Uma2 family endonuclease
MPLPKEQLHTIEDIYALPDGTRAELIDGQMYMMAPPNRRHQEIVFSLSRKIADYIDSKGGSCKTYIAPFAVFLNADNKNYVEPDISVICDRNKLTDNGCAGAPDWVIEIVSPGSRRMDYSTKVFKYRSAGVREYWIVDPDKKRITVWDFINDSTEEFSFSDSVKAGIYPDLTIDFQQLDI